MNIRLIRKKTVMVAATMLLMFSIPKMDVKAAETESSGSIEADIDISEMLSGVKEEVSQALQNMDEETVKEMFEFVKGKVSEGSLKTEEGLSNALAEAKEKFGVSIGEESAREVVETMEKLESMGFSGEAVIEKAEELYETYGTEFMEHINEVVVNTVKETVTEAVKSFFENLWEAIKAFFENLFGGS